MPTILLEQIIEILNNLYAGFGDYLNNLLVSLNLTKDDVSEINDNISAILDKASNISDNSDTITEVVNYIDGKLTTTNSYLNSIDGTSTTISSVVNDIRTYTGSVVTPIGSIKTNTDRLVTNSNTISNNTDSISNNIGTISASAGSTASNTNQIATNTQNTYNKVVTMASDTTQMRADNQTIIGVLNDMYDIMASTPVTMPADHVTYDPMSSGLVATNVQDAIDEITTRPAVLPTASDVSYSGTTSGLSATNVQDAIDEVVTDIPANATDLPISANDSTDTKTYIDTGLAKIGTIVNGTISGSVSCANETNTEIGSITLNKGIYILVACCDWGSNSSGYRQVGVSTNINGARNDISTTMACNGTNKETYVQFIKVLNIETDNTTTKVYGAQNSGGTLSAFPYIYAVRLA